MSRAAALALLLGACANPSPEEFSAEFPGALCAWVDDCAFDAPEPGAAACEDRAAAFVDQAEGDARCDWDAGQARQCLAALEGACEERTAIY